MMKRWLAALAALTMAMVFVGCNAEESRVTVWGIKGPTGIGMVHLMAEEQENYQFHIAASQDEVVAKVLTDEYDIGSMPTNLAAKLYAKTGGKLTVLAVNTAGVLSILEKGDTIHSVADLRGKTVYSSGQGANPEYVLNYILTQNGLTPGVDVTVRFVADNDELATVMAANGEATVAMLPEPIASSVRKQNAAVRTAIDMTEEWQKVSPDSELLMGCLVARTDFVRENPAAVGEFLAAYADSVNATADVDATAALCETYGIIPKAAIAKLAIPNCHLCYLDGEEMHQKLAGYLQVLYEADPTSVGGKLPDGAFYYEG